MFNSYCLWFQVAAWLHQEQKIDPVSHAFQPTNFFRALSFSLACLPRRTVTRRFLRDYEISLHIVVAVIGTGNSKTGPLTTAVGHSSNQLPLVHSFDFAAPLIFCSHLKVLAHDEAVYTQPRVEVFFVCTPLHTPFYMNCEKQNKKLRKTVVTARRYHRYRIAFSSTNFLCFRSEFSWDSKVCRCRRSSVIRRSQLCILCRSSCRLDNSSCSLQIGQGRHK